MQHHDRSHAYGHKIDVSNKQASVDIANRLAHMAHASVEEILHQLHSSHTGLTLHETQIRLKKNGLNEIVQEKRAHPFIRYVQTCNNPLVLLLFALIGVALVTGDIKTAILISIMILLSVTIRFVQENQAYNAADQLHALVKTTCTVLREGKEHEIDLRHVVTGDIVLLNAGDILPADVRIIESKDVFIDQSILTGESLPVEKHATAGNDNKKTLLESQNLCFMGTNVESGTARAVVIETGSATYFGSLAKSIIGQREVTSFDKGIDRFTKLIMLFMAVMVPLVFIINWFSKGNWWDAFLFSMSIAVGLTPELLPALVTVNLSKGSLMMARKKVIVKRLNSIQNFGAMDILCTDKTGTLTQNKIVLVHNLSFKKEKDEKVLEYAYLNSVHQSGFHNQLDEAVVTHTTTNHSSFPEATWTKVDEVPFDFERKRLSIIVKDHQGKKLLICKGAVEEISSICSSYETDGQHHELHTKEQHHIEEINREFSQEGFRVIAVAYKAIHGSQERFDKQDETALTFLGFMTFFDPPKESATAAVQGLERRGVSVKVLTGDNELVTRNVCNQVGVPVDAVLLGTTIETMDDETLRKSVENVSVFAKLAPEHKKRIIHALQQNGHVIGYLGDGINDAPALRTADVGISVNTAVDIAKESADIILLEKNLLVLSDGVLEGRRVFGNIIKYIKMGASSNFGNMFSVLGASIILPFLPMLPLQLITNNLLYDLSQTTIPTDDVDDEYIQKPRKWEIGDIGRFMLCIGPISSLFDYVTFGVMWFIFSAGTNPALFQTGWFVESLLTQVIIVHVIRSKKIPFLQTWASKPLIISTILVMSVGIYLTVSPAARALGFVQLPFLYWPILFCIFISYITLTQLAKTIYIRKFGYN